MLKYIYFKALTKEVKIRFSTVSAPSGFVKIGEYNHESEADPLGSPGSHVTIHHVQEALYHVGEQNMQAITLDDETNDELINFNLGADASIVGTDTHQIVPVFYPSNTSIKTLSYVSSAPGKATVNSSTGLVTGVSAGETTITATHAATGKTATKKITVTAPG